MLEEQFLTGNFWSEIFNNLYEWGVTNLPSIAIIIIVFLVALWLLAFFLGRLKKSLIQGAIAHDEGGDKEAEKRIRTLFGIIHAVGRVALWVVFIMILLGKFGINIAPILAGAGIIGLAVGFGAQELVRDIISGFFMILENQIRTGDIAILNGTGGAVEKIQLRTTTLRDFAGVVHVFQNGKISSLSNMTKEWSAAVLEIGVAYKEDIDQVIKIMEQVGEEMMKDDDFGPKFLEPIEVAGLDKFADSAIIIKARIKTKPVEQWAVGREYRKRLKKVFDAQNIEIPFPHRTIYWGEDINPLKLKNKENS